MCPWGVFQEILLKEFLESFFYRRVGVLPFYRVKEFYVFSLILKIGVEFNGDFDYEILFPC